MPCPRWPREGLLTPCIWARAEHLSGHAEGRSPCSAFGSPWVPAPMSTRAVKTAGRSFPCHCKYYHCLWYAEKQEEQRLLLPGGRRTKMRLGWEETEGVWEKEINKTSLVCNIYNKQPRVVWGRENCQQRSVLSQ